MNSDQVIQTMTILFGTGGSLGGLFALYKWKKERPLEETAKALDNSRVELQNSRISLDTAIEAMKALREDWQRQGVEIVELRDKLKKTKLEFEEESQKLRQEFKDKQHEMELRFCCMFSLYEMQILSLNATPILSKDNIMDANVDDLKKLVDTMRERANSVDVTEDEKKQGINRWSKMLELFSSELHKDIERIIIGG